MFSFFHSSSPSHPINKALAKIKTHSSPPPSHGVPRGTTQIAHIDQVNPSLAIPIRLRNPGHVSSAKTHHRQQLERLVETEELLAAEEDNWHIQQQIMLRQATLEREQIELDNHLEDECKVREEQPNGLRATQVLNEPHQLRPCPPSTVPSVSGALLYLRLPDPHRSSPEQWAFILLCLLARAVTPITPFRPLVTVCRPQWTRPTSAPKPKPVIAAGERSGLLLPEVGPPSPISPLSTPQFSGHPEERSFQPHFEPSYPVQHGSIFNQAPTPEFHWHPLQDPRGSGVLNRGKPFALAPTKAMNNELRFHPAPVAPLDSHREFIGSLAFASEFTSSYHHHESYFPRTCSSTYSSQ
ncbi:uncharacterized protein PGTG_01759 [Puccinia graminis f. sp. tritici CRL 75-36-700-3]|uniref:Uncharacterized protein n=1 Tax=Puccinia graminis f. sp. tritici (strain CRL 75-36-700-3 / race SCCL) TaxID=418459 RepID=E3JSZ1_PUCGT|nr:uncharacterized protein PGTG_01759 [Puccinia graminis f. sp. tritici CRL 75-36-700-3]EFP75166.1 hypothetical protein PGTG_01759 [Puccinia graminis f. sp. tritici CRL 75-36-700-3]